MISQSSIYSRPKRATSSDVIVYPSHANKVSSIDEALNELLGTLCEILRRLTRKAADKLNADRASIFLLDPQREAFASIIAEDGDGCSLVIEIPWDRGIVSLAARSLEVINIPFDVYDDPRSEESKNTDKATGYRTYSILAWPLFNKQKNLVGVVQLINKLKPNSESEDSLYKRIDDQGFTQRDEDLFAKIAPSIQIIIERCQFCYQLAKRLQENKAIVRDGVTLRSNELVAELKRNNQQMRKLLKRI